ncbi:MAG: PKD domain-containing protein [Solirubrobacteraceae bacterium]
MTIAVAALAALAAPVAAQAATYVVVPGGGSCGDPDLTCGTLQDAVGAVGNGDTVNVSPGQHAGVTTPFDNSGLTIAGTGPGVVVNGSVSFAAAGGGLVRNMTISQTGGAPAITTAGTAGLEVRDVVAFSAGSHGILFTAGTANKIVRSVVITGNGNGTSSAVRVNSTDAGAKALRLESTLVNGGNAGVAAVATGLLPGDISIQAFHLTAAGSTSGLLLQALPIGLGGNVSATYTNSITLTNNRVPGALSAATLTPTGANIEAGDRNLIFADPQNSNFRLKPGSPAINAGSAPAAGESTTDVDGQDRSTAPTDLGADEYVNTAPKAAIAVKTQVPRDGQPVVFDGGGSKDQPGGSIASYRWDFGDGATQTTAAPTVSHTYKGEGPRTARLTVVDGEGAASAVASTTLTVIDGTAPAVVITKPKNKQKIFQFVRKTKTVTRNGKKVKIKVKTKKRTRIRFTGAAADKSGVARVFMTVEKTANPGTTTVIEGSQASTKRCRWLDPKLGLRRRSCSQPIVLTIKLKSNGTWAYTVRKSIKLSKGTYRAIVYGLDKTNMFGNAAPKAKRNIRFTIR